MNIQRAMALAGLVSGSLAAFPAAAAFDLGNCGTIASPVACPYVTYGDGNSYALAVNAAIFDAVAGGGTGPGNPFYVASTPGAIKDQLVVSRPF